MKDSLTKETSLPAPGLLLIAAFKFAKAAVLLAFGIAALKLVHKDVADEIATWADVFRIDPDNLYVQRLLERMSILSDRRIIAIGMGSFFYSALFITEGIGLALGKRWAEYLTTIITSSLLPVEVYEIVKRVSYPRIAVLVFNVAVVIYLVIELRRNPDIRRTT